ncbi:nuclear transport factor 2 family protein [Solidesulfovibrio sp.]|uniref:nuclear transport factor 2 family protein n=1 Tax=Solidesulfovibrio sp. TaxID=2910990 RepID=UPI0026159618|nr:nuclear transport factor 2 family protein [Solidesulfovibrio sp.]
MDTNMLPKPVADYLAAANAHDPEAVAACFTARAVVADENREHVGRAAIRDWIAAADAQYAPTVEPLRVEADGPNVVLYGKVSGTFPGSPATLRFAFVLEGEKIARLTITE